MSVMPLHILLCSLIVFLWATVGAVGTVLETRVTTLTISTQYIRQASQNQNSHEDAMHNMARLERGTTLTPRTIAQQPKPFSNCHDSCTPLFASLETCYAILHNHINLSDPSQSPKYRLCLCNAESASNSLNYARTGSPYDQCLQCLSTSDLDISLQSNFTETFHGFCSTDKPSVFLFLYRILDFLLRARVPTDFPVLRGPIKTITNYVADFTVLPGMNEAPSTTAFLPPFPTECLLTQLPPHWPHTSYGVARRPGQSTTWTLTDSDLDGRAAAIVVASLQWYPRPLGKQKGLAVEREWSAFCPSTTTDAVGTLSTETTSISEMTVLQMQTQTQTQAPIQTVTPLALGGI